MRYADGIVYVKRGDNYVPMRAENLLYAATGSNSVELGFWNAKSGEVDTYIEPDQNQVTVAEQTAREMKKIFPGRLLESRYGNGIRVLWPLDKLDWDRIFPLERKTRLQYHDMDYYANINIYFKGVTTREPVKRFRIGEYNSFTLLSKLLDEFYRVRNRVRKGKGSRKLNSVTSEFDGVLSIYWEPHTLWVTLATCSTLRQILKRDLDGSPETRELVEKEFQILIRTKDNKEVRIRNKSLVLPGVSFLKRSDEFALQLRNPPVRKAYTFRIQRSEIERCNLAELIASGAVVPETDPDMIELPNSSTLYVPDIKYVVMQSNSHGVTTQAALYVYEEAGYSSCVYLAPKRSKDFLESRKDMFVRMPGPYKPYWVSRKHLHMGLTAQEIECAGGKLQHRVFLRNGEALGIYLNDDEYQELKEKLEES